MRKLISLVMGFGLGATIGAAMVMLFSPTSGEQLVDNIKRGYAETMAEARKASAVRRAELEAQLAQMRAQNAPRLPK
ncbi:MAG: YtxH domain-containing protein [Chloroflexota bacterium]